MKKFVIIIVTLVLFLGLFFLLKLKDFYKGIYTPTTFFVKPKTQYNFLLLGYGGGNHDGAYLTDTIMILHLDTITKRALLISLPRDMWVKIPTKTGEDFHAKINSVYEMEMMTSDFPNVDKTHFGTATDANFAKYIISQITGLPIDYYAGIDFDGFKTAIDTLGGVDINVTTTFDDYEYPIDGKEKDLCGRDGDFAQIAPYLDGKGDPNQKAVLFKDHPDLEKFFNDITDNPNQAFPCRYQHVHFDKGLNHMDGATALKYVRSRHSSQDGSDFGRAQRQQLLLEGIKNKVLSVGFIPKIIPLLDQMQKYIKTDVSLTDLNKFIGLISTASSYSLRTVVPTDKDQLKDDFSADGQFVLVPIAGIDHWQGFQSWIKNEIEAITPTPEVTPITGR